MRKILLATCALALLAPISLMASVIDFGSVNGTLAASGSTLTTSSSAGGAASSLQSVNGSSLSLNANPLGMVNFTSGSMSSGSLSSGGAFGSGGTITVTSNGDSFLWGSAANQIVFNGMFTGNQMWTSLGNGFYSFSGQVSGTFSNAFASLFNLTSTSGSGLLASGEVHEQNGVYNITSADLAVPEAQTIILLAVGLLGLFAMRRKFALAA